MKKELKIAVVENNYVDWINISQAIQESTEEGYVKKESIPESNLIPWIFDYPLKLSWIGPSDKADFSISESEDGLEKMLCYILIEGFHSILIAPGLGCEEDEWIKKNIIDEPNKEEFETFIKQAPKKRGGFWLINELFHIREAGGFIPYITMISQFEVINRKYRLWFLKHRNVLNSYDKTNFGIEEGKDILFYAAHAAAILPDPSLNGRLSWLWWKNQISIPVSIIPFLEHNNQTRLQMVSSQMKQPILLKNPELLMLGKN